MSARKKADRPLQRACRLCRCTEERACRGGCSWISDRDDLCSRCWDGTIATPSRLLSDKVAILLVGAGGNGSQMLTGLARLNVALTALTHPGLEVTVFDPDYVAEANLGRQLFTAADVGQNKAEVLVQRTNAFFGFDWKARPDRFGAKWWHSCHAQIVISCVDSARSRIEIGRCIDGVVGKPLLWLDLGNRASDGQVVLGIPAWNKEHASCPLRLPTVLELFPELASNPASFDKDDAPSCSLAQALDRQELFVNQAVVTMALQMLWSVFRHGRIAWSGAFVNLQRGRVNPIPIDPEAWARMGYVRETARPPKRAADLEEMELADEAAAIGIPLMGAD